MTMRAGKTNWQGVPAGRPNNRYNTLNAFIDDDNPPGCAEPEEELPDPNKTTAYLDSTAFASISRKDVICAAAKVQELNFSLNTTSHIPIFTTKTLRLLLSKLPPEACKAFQVDDIPYNLIAVVSFVDTGCSVQFYPWGFNMDYNGETIYKGWREGKKQPL